MVPTRELAIQITEVFQILDKFLGEVPGCYDASKQLQMGSRGEASCIIPTLQYCKGKVIIESCLC